MKALKIIWYQSSLLIWNIHLKYLLNILSSENIKNIDYIFFYKFNLIFVIFEAEEFPKEHSLSKSILLPFSLLRWVWLFRSSSLSFIFILSVTFFYFHYLSHSLLFLFYYTLALIIAFSFFFTFCTDTVEMTSYGTDKGKDKIASSAQRQKRRVGGMSSGAMGTLRCVDPFCSSLSLYSVL